MKLRFSEIDCMGLPLSSSDDHIDRHAIIDIVIERAKKHYSKVTYDRVIYVGDRQWDYKAACDLGIGFIGVGHYLKDSSLNIPTIVNYTDGSLIKLLDNYSSP